VRWRSKGMKTICSVCIGVCLSAYVSGSRAQESSAQLERWLAPQEWIRDGDGPAVSLGASGAFDDMHLFAPTVVRENGKYRLWYCGSRGTVAERILRLGLTESADGTRFEKCAVNPVFDFGDGRHSVMTPTVLKTLDGTPIREGGRLRLWFSSTDFTDKSGRHTLHETTSEDGLHWSAPSAEQLANVYAPTVLKDNDGKYRLWYTDVSAEPWVINHATSADGRAWQVTAQPVLVIDQGWEKGRLFYPCVVQVEGVFLMWYGSYWKQQPQKTALGFAVSADGIQWRKHPGNPVFRPEPAHAWESHYTTSQSVMRLPDGTWRIWYGSRTAPPFVHKYFAVGSARWAGK
jgi:predicted GH43/DUF377 family glycosyl hydrolase